MKKDNKIVCVVLNKQAEENLNTILRLLTKTGEDELVLNRSLIIRKALALYARQLRSRGLYKQLINGGTYE